MDTDRNLLFGVLAMQADLIDAEQFAEACSAWAARKSTALADLLQDRGWIDAEGRADVEKLLARKLRRHGGDVHASLVEAVNGRALAALEAIDDPETRQTLGGLASAGDEPPLTTVVLDEPEPGDRYHRTRLIGHGGLGQVWLARDGDLGREVALKELRGDRAEAAELRSRFLEEARITGQLQHPGIVPVFELGRPGAGGSPFYTMRFVRGRTLSEAIRDDQRSRGKGTAGALERSALLDAFVDVCNAVAYAHSRGVIHRDLKGQNIILGNFGEVIVLDWGLAKLVGQEAEEPACSIPPLSDGRGSGQTPTIQGKVMGTPAYMAPEQAEGHWDRVDRRSDIYSLGAILFEILTGVPPFRGRDTSEVLRRVVHERPEAPRQIRPDAPAALEAIALKALAKRPEDRYESAAELATEVRRFLADQPVAAHRESIAARAARWSRKHQAAVVGLAVLMVTALVALSIGVWSVRREQARTLAARDRAEANFRAARRAVDEYLTRVSESKLLNTPGLQPLRKELLDAALKYYQGFIQQRRDDPALQAELAEAYHRVGNINTWMGRKPEAVTFFREGLAVLERLERRVPGREATIDAEGGILYDLAATLSMIGRRDEAIAAIRRSVAVRERLARAHPTDENIQGDLASSQAGLALLLHHYGQYGTAEEAYRAPVATLKKLAKGAGRAKSLAHDRLNIAQIAVATLYRNTGRLDEAARLFESTLKTRKEIARQNPDVLTDQLALAMCHQGLAEVYSAQGKLEPAEANLRDAVRVYEAIVKANPEVADGRLALGSGRMALAEVRRRRGHPDEFEAMSREGLETIRAVVAAHPGSAMYRDVLAGALDGLGDDYRETGAADRARSSYREAVDLYRALDRERPGDASRRKKLAWCLNDLGLVAAAVNRPEESESANRESLAIWEGLVRDRPSDPDLVVNRASTQINLGLWDDFRGRGAAALDWFARAIDDMTPLAAKTKGSGQAKVQLNRGLTSRAAALTKLGRHAEALADWDRIVALDDDPENLTPRLARLAALARSGEHARAVVDGEALFQGRSRQAVNIYDLACVCALASASAARDSTLSESDRAAIVERDAARAVALLGEARELGLFRNPAFIDHMQKDADLDSLRSRADYRALVHDLTRPSASAP